jgi:hypothetical protein
MIFMEIQPIRKIALLMTSYLLAASCFSQDTVGIKINRLYMEHAEQRKLSVYLSPPLLAGNTLRYRLSKELAGKAMEIPPNILAFDIGIQKFISDHFAIGLQYQLSQAKVKGAALINKTTSAYQLTDLSVTSHNLLLTGRYYYDIVLKSRWDSKQHPKSAERLRKGFRRMVMFSGIGLGYGKVSYDPSNAGTYDYPELKRLNDFVVGIELLGLQYYFSKHWGVFFTLGTLNTGIYTAGHSGIFINP